jgi:hypothetical protein
MRRATPASLLSTSLISDCRYFRSIPTVLRYFNASPISHLRDSSSRQRRLLIQLDLKTRNLSAPWYLTLNILLELLALRLLHLPSVTLNYRSVKVRRNPSKYRMDEALPSTEV